MLICNKNNSMQQVINLTINTTMVQKFVFTPSDSNILVHNNISVVKLLQISDIEWR